MCVAVSRTFCALTDAVCLSVCLANLPTAAFSSQLAEHVCGIYLGWAGLADRGVYKMVMSVGWNPYFDNAEKTVVRPQARMSLEFTLAFAPLALRHTQAVCVNRNRGFCTTFPKIFMEKNFASSSWDTSGPRYIPASSRFIRLLALRLELPLSALITFLSLALDLGRGQVEVRETRKCNGINRNESGPGFT